MALVGGSVVASSALTPRIMFTAGAIRYTIACALLVAFARATGRRIVRPGGTQWLWLSGIAAGGLVLFNVALVEGSRHAEPAVLGVAVACVPPVLAAAGPLLQGARPALYAVRAALVVTAGAIAVEGLGRADAAGIGWAVVVFCCEAAFTLLAIPVLDHHGAWGVSVHSTWLGAVFYAIIAAAREGPATAARITPHEWGAIGYLAVAVTAMAFLLWYASVQRLGPARAGLLAGVAPVAAAVIGVAGGGPVPRPVVWAGMAVVGGGLFLGRGPGVRRPGVRRPGVRGPGVRGSAHSARSAVATRARAAKPAGTSAPTTAMTTPDSASSTSSHG
jgi:drug/metabolite transporter (DMT)-like permease